MSEEKQRDEAGQFGGVYGSKNKAVREKATRSLWKKLGIEMPSSGKMISDQDRKILNRMLSGTDKGTMISDQDRKILNRMLSDQSRMVSDQDRKILNRMLSGKKSGSKMGGGKVKKNYSRGGGVRAAKY